MIKFNETLLKRVERKICWEQQEYRSETRVKKKITLLRAERFKTFSKHTGDQIRYH